MTDESKTNPDHPEGHSGTAAAEHHEHHGKEGHLPTEDDKPEPIVQQVDVSDSGPCKKHVKVTVDRASIDSRLDKQYSKLRFEANVAGFRPGKTPRKVVERRFHKEVTEQVKGELLMQSLEQLSEEIEITPLSPPNLNPYKIEIPESGPLVYEFDVEVPPQFELPAYKGLKLKKPTKTYSNEEVEAATRQWLSEHGQIVPKPEGSKVELGDIIVADVTSKFGDRVLNEVSECPVRVEQQLALKDGVSKDFGAKMKGARAGEKRTVDVTLSSRAADAELRGKTIKVTLDIKDVKTVRLPELTPEFLSAHYGVRTPEQLQEAIRVLLERRLEYLQLQSYRNQIVSLLSKDNKWDLPRDLLERQAKRAFARRVMEMRSQGISDQEIEGRRRVLEEDVVRSTANSLVEHFILQRIAQEEKIDINDDDIEAEVERIAAANNESPRRLRARLEKEDMLEVLATEILERRALSFILENAEWEEVPLGAEEDSNVSTIDAQAVPGEMEELKNPEEEMKAQMAEEAKGE
jgi:trigger factor